MSRTRLKIGLIAAGLVAAPAVASAADSGASIAPQQSRVTVGTHATAATAVASATAGRPTDRVRLTCPGKGRLWLVVEHPNARTDRARIVARKLVPEVPWRWRLVVRSLTSKSVARGTSTAGLKGSWSSGALTRSGPGKVTFTATAHQRHKRSCGGSYP